MKYPPVLVLGWLLFAAGLLLLAFKPQLSVVVGCGVLYLACRCIIRGRKLRALTADELMRRDSRPPVIYLRSFTDDEPEPDRSGWRYGLLGETSEQQLATAFRQVGPFVAIGRPGELPDLGASRLYADENDWQARVLELFGRAGLVVLQLGYTPGFRWELDQALAQVDLRRLLIFVPAGGGPMYDRLAELVQERHGIEIPARKPVLELASVGAKPPDAHFLYFDHTSTLKILFNALHTPGKLGIGFTSNRRRYRFPLFYA